MDNNNVVDFTELEKIEQGRKLLQNHNNNFLKFFESHANDEIKTILNSTIENKNPSDISHIMEILQEVCSVYISILQKHVDDRMDLVGLNMAILNSLSTIARGGILSPISGNDDEWREIKSEPREMLITFRGKECRFLVTSVEENIRYPKIRRFNHDNRLAHTYTGIGFVSHNDENDDERINYSAESIRYIKFPYTMSRVEIECTIDGDKLIPVDYDIPALHDQIVFIDSWNTHVSSNEDEETSVAIMPPVPFYFLDELGIDINAEIEAEIERINSFVDDDDEFDDEDMTEEELKSTEAYKAAKNMIAAFIATNETNDVEAIREWLHSQNIFLNTESIIMVLEDIAGETSANESIEE